MSSADIQVAQDLERLQATIAAEQQRRGELIPPLTPEEEAASQGTRRTHAEMEGDDSNIDPRLTAPLGAPYTLEEGRTYKRSKNLSSQADTDAEAFLLSVHPMRHAYETYVAVLQCLDRLNRLEAENNSKYKVPSTLEGQPTSIGTTETAVPLLITSWNIKAAMRLLNTKDLPAPNETGRVAMVIACINKGLTDWRCHVKSSASMSNPIGEGKQEIHRHVDTHLHRQYVGESDRHLVSAHGTYSGVRTHLSGEGEEGQGLLARCRCRAGPSPQGMHDSRCRANNNKSIYGNPDTTIPVTTLQSLDPWLAKIDEGVAIA
ncbi:hypothetical protein C8J57DRAFT_1244160 [Mycena rebaudengoi]|nr:hypothetical protein C8J57DRAFT_1244160 [Mycena rebaudengoi]